MSEGIRFPVPRWLVRLFVGQRYVSTEAELAEAALKHGKASRS